MTLILQFFYEEKLEDRQNQRKAYIHIMRKLKILQKPYLKAVTDKFVLICIYIKI